MRASVFWVVALCLGAGWLFAAGVSAQGPDLGSAPVLAAAREALGGDAKLTAVKSFTATGRTRQLRGNNLVPIEFEIDCELPDKFVRKDEFPAQDTALTTTGFIGDELIQQPPPARAGAAPNRGGGAPPNPAQQRLNAVKQDFARLMLGVFAASFSSYPLAFKYAGEAEAPTGKADVLDVTGGGNFAARFIVERASHMPALLIWQLPGPSPSTPTEFRLYYGDFRDVDGMKWPFRIRRAIGGETVEETTFDRIRINPKIDPKKFTGAK